MSENPTAILVELYAEQAKNGASDEQLAMTMERIKKHIAPTPVYVAPRMRSESQKLRDEAKRAVDLEEAIARERAHRVPARIV